MKCRKLESGVWECYEEGPRDPITLKRNAVRKQSKSKAVAQQKVRDALKQLESDVNKWASDRVTFEEIAWEWHRVYALSGVKNSTIRNRRSSIRVLLRYIENVPIGRVDHQTLQNILIDLDNKKNSRSLMEGVKVTADFIFKHAMKLQLRHDNPAVGLTIPTKRLTVEEIESEEIQEKYFENDELEAFLQAAIREGLPLDVEWFYLMAFTGMRIGEVCALKWTDINFEEKWIRVTKTIDMPNHNMREYELTPPKTKKAIRTFEIDDDLIHLLKRHKTRQAQIRLLNRQKPDYHDKNFVFCRDNGYPYSSRFVYDRTVRLCRRAGLSTIEGPHILRHTHITMMAQSGVELHTIMNRVGHEDAQTTKNIYLHVTKQMKKDATEQVHNRFGSLFYLKK